MAKGASKSMWEYQTKQLVDFINRNDLHDRVEQYNKYHFRIFTDDGFIDIWPGVKKYYEQATGRGRTYQNVKEIKQYL